MPTKSAYQKQADKRTKNALKLRARFDAKARKAATLLVAALAGADDATARINRLNALYNVDISTQTLLVHDLKTAGLDASLASMMADSTPGEELQLFNANVDGNAGAALALEVVFGELPVLTGGVLVDRPPVPVAALILDQFSHNFSDPYDNVTIRVLSPVPTDSDYRLTFDSPGAFSYTLGMGEIIGLSIPNVRAGQVITLTAQAASGARVTHTFTVGE